MTKTGFLEELLRKETVNITSDFGVSHSGIGYREAADQDILFFDRHFNIDGIMDLRFDNKRVGINPLF